MRDMYYYEPRKGHGLPHDPFSAIVGPRPIGWISTMSADGAANLAPYSFFNGFNYTPPIIGFASVGWKDTVENVKFTKQSVWNLATHDLAEAMNKTSASVSSDIDEFSLAGLTKVASTKVVPPR
jgi:flavin reductase (DIM6/NTAB) family NADH-FMN oxidoreductase RutF